MREFRAAFPFQYRRHNVCLPVFDHRLRQIGTAIVTAVYATAFPQSLHSESMFNTELLAFYTRGGIHTQQNVELDHFGFRYRGEPAKVAS